MGMQEVKLLVWTASGTSTLAVLVCVLVMPQLYWDINQIYDEVGWHWHWQKEKKWNGWAGGWVEKVEKGTARTGRGQ